MGDRRIPSTALELANQAPLTFSQTRAPLERHYVPTRMILEVKDATGKVIYHAPDPQPTQVVSPQAAYLVTDILAGNTDPRQNPIWAAPLELRNGPGHRHRPTAVKTGTASDARDLATYVYVAQLGSRTAYFWNQYSWGGPLFGSCQRPKPAGRHNKPPGHGGGGHGGGGGGGGDGGEPMPTPPAPTSPP